MAAPPVTATVWLGGVRLLGYGPDSTARLTIAVCWLLLGLAGIAASTQAVARIVTATEFAATTWRIGAGAAAAVTAAMLVGTGATIVWGLAYRASQGGAVGAAGWLTVTAILAVTTGRAVIALVGSLRAASAEPAFAQCYGSRTCGLRPAKRTGSGTAMASGQYDFIIIGGGSAWSALANRLSAHAANRVLVLEAGRPDYKWDVFIHMPAALTFPIGSRFYDWKYESEPEPHMNGRRIYHARGKVLGGSSSINGMIFQRGNPLDYERWAADPGMASWNYAHCLPYFKRMENCLAADPDDPFRGHTGPLVLERGPATNPLFGAFFSAVQQAGYQLTDDVNGYRQEGFAPFDRNVHRGRRLSAS